MKRISILDLPSKIVPTLVANIDLMDDRVDPRVPAMGSVSIRITTPDGHSRTETGRVELLEEALITAAKHCGIGIEGE